MAISKNWTVEIIQCSWCKSDFSRSNPRKIFCSDKCKHDMWISKPENKLAKYKRSLTWNTRRPDSILKKRLKKYYNITVEQFENMYSSQNGVCKICKRICPSGRRLSVDHDHDTGKIRGLLCMKCNKGLGSFEDNVENMKIAIEYLKESK